MNMNREAGVLGSPEAWICQGDIYSQDLVAPYCDHIVRVFRTADGEHGSLVFESGREGYVFGLDELQQVVAESPSDPMRTAPFDPTPDGDREMVVVTADLSMRFVVASQTCDVSGKDHPPRPFAVIAPFTSIAGVCRTADLPIVSREGEAKQTILGYLVERGVFCASAFSEEDDYRFSSILRERLDRWKPTERQEREIRGRIRDFLNGFVLNRLAFVYYLRGRETLGIPEGFVDFCRLFTIPTDRLRASMDLRSATIRPPYREEFSKKLGDYLSRIATPSPAAGDRL